MELPMASKRIAVRSDIEKTLNLLLKSNKTTSAVKRAIFQLRLQSLLHPDDYKEASNNTLIAMDIYVSSDDFQKGDHDYEFLLQQALAFISDSIEDVSGGLIDPKLYSDRIKIVNSLLALKLDETIEKELRNLKDKDTQLVSGTPLLC